MRKILTLLFLIITKFCITQNPYVGRWVMYDIKSFKNQDTLSQKQKKVFKSIIIFNEDMTFVKTTNGQTTTGKYEFTSNKFIFLEQDIKGKHKVSWSIRWPRNTTDPIPQTPQFDLCYPELFIIKGEPIELDVFYIKESE